MKETQLPTIGVNSMKAPERAEGASKVVSICTCNLVKDIGTVVAFEKNKSKAIIKSRNPNTKAA